MATWITICDLTKYDVEGAFSSLGTIDWKQSTNVEAGDIVYIYVSKPIGGIKFKCRANKVNLPNCQIDDSEWVLDGSPFENYGRYMELELLHKFDTVIPYLSDLQDRGIKAIMGPLTVNTEALEFII